MLAYVYDTLPTTTCITIVAIGIVGYKSSSNADLNTNIRLYKAFKRKCSA